MRTLSGKVDGILYRKGTAMRTRTQSGEIRCVILVMLPMTCILPFGCAPNEADTPATATLVTKGESCRNIEHVIAAELPLSATHCRYYFRPVGGWGGGMVYAYFELSRGDALPLLDKSQNLPDARELRSDPLGWDPWRATDEDGAAISWWQPRRLQGRQFADKHHSDWAWATYVCLGRTDTGRTGLYIFYTAD